MPAHPLDDIVVFDPDGGRVSLGSIRSGRVTVFAFVRHFGCLFCRQQMAELLAARDAVFAAGGHMVVIGQGSIEEARVFRDENELPGPLLTDPSRQAYCAVDLRRGAGTVFRPAVFWAALRAWRHGFRQSRTAGDPLQQGGVVVVGPDGRERYRYISRWAGDHPRQSSLVAACGAVA